MRTNSIRMAAGMASGFAILALTGCGGDANSSGDGVSVGSASKGAPIFRRVCKACHGDAGEGMPNLGKDMTRSAFIKDSTDEALLEFIKIGRLPTDPLSDGITAMPPKGGDPALTDKQILDVIAFVRKLQKK